MQVISPKYGRQKLYYPQSPQKPKISKRIALVLFLLVTVAYGLSKMGFKKDIFIEAENVGEVLAEQVQADVSGKKLEQKDSISEGRLVESMIKEGDTPAKIFADLGKLDANDMESILASAENVYDFTNVRIGKNIRFYFDGEKKANRIEYDRDTESVVIVEREGDVFKAYEEKINYEISAEKASGIIDNFFYADALEAGLSEPTVLEVGDIFSFNIDFTTEIRQGDEFVFIYEKRKREGNEAPDGKILAAKFINDGTAHHAYYFEGGYYDNEGRVLERQFLKAPLSYRRITSGYTGARLHPITRKISAHYQIDYSAPSGTPVVSTARGTVTSAGFEAGWGNIIRIRHDNGYATHYAHLSKYAAGIKSGVSVSQGQVIGYVGSTGWSTGPHLDFGMKLDGNPINPLKLDLPKGTPLDETKIALFEEEKKKYSQIFE